jgi:hypothetical protein
MRSEVWVIQSFMGWTIDANVLKFGKVVVGPDLLDCVVVWLAGILGGGYALPHLFPYR